MSRREESTSRREGGDAWVFERLVDAIPKVSLSSLQAVILQILLFEAAVLLLGWYYGLEGAIVAGTVAVAVAGAGSYAMLRLADGHREMDAPPAYSRLLFESSVEVLLTVVAFVALVVYLFVVDPRSAPTLVESLLGPEPPAAAAFLLLLVLWDLCYRIGTAWWAAVVALWRALRVPLTPADRAVARRLDRITVGFGLVQLALLPLLVETPILFVAVLGHVVAVVIVVGAAGVISRSQCVDCVH